VGPALLVARASLPALELTTYMPCTQHGRGRGGPRHKLMRYPLLACAAGVLLLLVIASCYGQWSLCCRLFLPAFVFTGILTWRAPWVAYLAFTFLYPLFPFLPEAPFRYHELLFLCLAFWWTVRKWTDNRSTGIGSLTLPLSCLAVFLGGSCLLSLAREHLLLSPAFALRLLDHRNIMVPWDPRYSFSEIDALLHWLEGMFLFVITVDLVDSSARARQLLRVIVAAAVTVAALGILQYLFDYRLLAFWLEENPNLHRINSTWDDPNVLGTYLAAGVPLILCTMPDRRKIAYFSGLAVLAWALILTASRAALGAALAVGTFLGSRAIFDRSGKVGAWRLFRRWLLGALLAISLFALYSSRVDFRDPRPHTIGQLLLFTFNPNLPLETVSKGRTEAWKAAGDIFASHPLVGCGIGAFLHFMPAYNSLHPGVPNLLGNAHNYYLQFLAETGIAGFLLVGLVLVRIFRSAARAAVQADHESSRLLMGSSLAVAVILATSLTGHPLLLLKSQFLFWTLLGLLWAVARANEPVVSGRKFFSADRVVLFAAIGISLTGFITETKLVLRTRNVLPYEYGFYGYEKDSSGRTFRWTAQEAASVLPVRGNLLSLALRQVDPAIGRRECRTVVEIDGRPIASVVFDDSEWKEFRHRVPADRQAQTITVRIRSNKYFVPRLEGMGSDPRKLGVMVAGPDWACCTSDSPAGAP
jgi:putative inorganic carbon (HCO3(-)) transporter